jgi:hypothetical protein
MPYPIRPRAPGALARSTPAAAQGASAQAAVQLKLRAEGGCLQPGRQTKKQKRLEESVQESIEQALRSRGYWVLSTSEHRRRELCPHCQKWMVPQQGRGCDKGVPDLLVTSGRTRKLQWPPGMWMGLEVKGPTTVLTREQKLLREERRIFIVKQVETALRLVQEFELSLIG